MKNIGKQFISELKLYSDYLKWNSNLERYETWEEACKDVLNVHITKYGEKVKPLINKILPYYQNKNFLVSQRALQFRNEQLLKNNCRLYNCSVAYCYSPDIFKKGFFMLLSGAGFGVNLQNKYVKQLPKLNKREGETITYVVQDSIEGWCNASNALISSYCQHPSLKKDYFGKKIRFDYSLIRPEGSYISGGFKAPGHKGLQQSLENIENFLEKELIDDQIDFTAYRAYNIFMYLSNAVLSGGVRRSAMNVIMDKTDNKMIHAKTGNWRKENPHFARSNNSVGLLKNSFTKEEFKYFLDLNEGDNDCGFVLLESEDQMFNPCVSGNSLIHTNEGLYFPKNLTSNNSVVLGGKSFKSKPFHQTGFQPTLEFKTDSGRKLRVTGNHLMLLGNEQNFVTADSLSIGDTLTISNNELKNINIDSESNDFKKGYLVGSFLGDGNFSKESCQIKFWGNNKEDYHKKCVDYVKDLGWNYRRNNKTNTQYLERIYTTLENKQLYNFIKEKDNTIISNKRLTKEILEGSFNYVSGLIAGYFDADGTVSYSKNKGSSIRITSSQIENLENIQIGLNSLGVYSKIYSQRNKSSNGVSLLPNGKGGKKLFKVKDSHEIVITKKSIENFYKNIPFLNIEKRNKIQTILESYTRPFYKTSYIEKIVEIKQHILEDVWDCEVEKGVEMFDCNGIVVHNCFEIGFDFYNKITDFNDTVIQMCNLCEINASECKNKKNELDVEKFLTLCEVASIAGTLQAGYTNFPYLGKQTEDIVKGEALLGVSITGWMDNLELFSEPILKQGAKKVVDTNIEIAKLIEINAAARTTCTKPSGNASVILGTPSGIHPEHSEKYFRIMQINKENNVAKWLLKNYPEMIEESTWSPTKTDYVVFVPIENSKNGKFKETLKDIEHLELIKLVQNSWVKNGKNKTNAYNVNINHNVSNTIIIDNREKVVDFIFNNQESFVAVSFLTRYGDKDFNQAPFTSILDQNELLNKYGSGVMFASGLIVDGLHYFNNDLWKACNYLSENNFVVNDTRDKLLLQKDWARRVKKFAKNYFGGDLKQTVYCLKDVHLFHKWCNINRNFKFLPNFNELLPKPDYINIDELGAIACQGGACEIPQK